MSNTCDWCSAMRCYNHLYRIICTFLHHRSLRHKRTLQQHRLPRCILQLVFCIYCYLHRRSLMVMWPHYLFRFQNHQLCNTSKSPNRYSLRCHNPCKYYPLLFYKNHILGHHLYYLQRPGWAFGILQQKLIPRSSLLSCLLLLPMWYHLSSIWGRWMVLAQHCTQNLSYKFYTDFHLYKYHTPNRGWRCCTHSPKSSGAWHRCLQRGRCQHFRAAGPDKHWRHQFLSYQFYIWKLVLHYIILQHMTRN